MGNSSIRLAVIDDHVLFLQGLSYVFENCDLDLEVQSFTTATSFLNATDDGQKWDVVVTDLAMKQINGIALIGALRARDMGVQVIVLSASEDTITRSNAEMVGAFCFVHKSSDEYGLAEASPPEGDLYDLSAYGIPMSSRSGIKKDIQAAINSKKPLKKMPQGATKCFPKPIAFHTLSLYRLLTTKIEMPGECSKREKTPSEVT
ncbi:response regulator [uncultured Shimia sp.]|uniref:response regulator n=1 Tax=uncultured Shimia sp. TaxID=573152 RepID=UPI00260D51DA|nr:response regulator [uncultured Shimia sp.]